LGTKINEIKTENNTNNQFKSWFFQRISTNAKPLAKLTKIVKENTQINKIRDKKEHIRTNTNEIQRIMKEYFENQYPNKEENLEGMDKFLDVFDLLNNQEDINHLNRSITSNEIESSNRVS
jgi:hypothetical protein